MTYSKTKTSFYRRLFVAHLIDRGLATVPSITEVTGMPRRTVQDTILALGELDIICEFKGANKDGHYCIKAWGGINKQWITDNLRQIQGVLGIVESKFDS